MLSKTAATESERSNAQTLCQAFQLSAERVPDRIALRTPGDATSLTWAEYAAAVQYATGRLSALGVRRGDRVAFLSGNCPELAICETAALHLGAAGVAIYPASPPPTIEHVLTDSDPVVLLVQSGLRARLAEARHAVAHVLDLDPETNGQAPSLASATPSEGFDFQSAWRDVRPDDLAALIYTSGTTGVPKAVEWTHRAAIGNLAGFDGALGEPDGIHDISYAPFASLAERYGGHWHALVRGSTRTVCPDPTQLLAALLDARPTRLGGPPQVWQRLKLGLEASLDPREREALDAARQRFRERLRGGAPQPLSEDLRATLERLRARLGLDGVNRAGSTAAPCPPALHEHYGALGVPFQEFFAMTETGVVAAQGLGGVDFGTLGPAVPGCELRIAQDGELLVRAGHGPRAYRNRARDTAETFGADGWVSTGDTGVLDVQGRLRLVGRKKEMIVPTHGHNVAPAPIESALKDAYPQIAQACVLGDGRPHLVALVVLDPPELGADKEARRAVAAAVESVNRSLEPRERIEAHALVTDAWLPGAELTETLKMRRAHITERYGATIDELYVA
jgi:long-chain acyl-CoA synthetase